MEEFISPQIDQARDNRRPRGLPVPFAVIGSQRRGLGNEVTFAVFWCIGSSLGGELEAYQGAGLGGIDQRGSSRRITGAPIAGNVPQ
jgi:hypothetical protein